MEDDGLKSVAKKFGFSFPSERSCCEEDTLDARSITKSDGDVITGRSATMRCPGVKPHHVMPYKASILTSVHRNSMQPMPPRILIQRVYSTLSCSFRSYRPSPSFLLPPSLAPHQQRFASILSDLRDTKGAYNKRIRRGRGPASGKGKTSGRGHKGQKQHGKVPKGFNGGQTPDIVVSGTRGFDNQYVGHELRRVMGLGMG
jgi:hypothetical protein